MRTPFTGVGTALITPFTKSGALDEPAIKRLARRQVENGVHFLVPCGTTGETPTLSAAERRSLAEQQYRRHRLVSQGIARSQVHCAAGCRLRTLQRVRTGIEAVSVFVRVHK